MPDPVPSTTLEELEEIVAALPPRARRIFARLAEILRPPPPPEQRGRLH